MARAGLFDDLDAVLAWHPSNETQADTGSSQAMVDFVVEFRGRTSHAAYDPWNGRSAADGLEIFQHAINLLREHVRPSVRIHYAIISAGDVPNVVPEYAKLWCWVRDSTREGVGEVMERVHKIAKGAALAADVDSELRIQAGSYEMLANMAGARLLYTNLQRLGPLEFNDQEHAFARALQEATGGAPVGLDGSIQTFEENPGPPEGGSTDVADVSWIVPTIHLSATTAPGNVPWHAWPVVASSGMEIGQRGMLYAAKALAATMVDLFTDPEALAAMRAEHAEKTAGHTYDPWIPDGPPPVPIE